MTTAHPMTINRAAVLHAPAATARHISRASALILGGLLYLLVMAYLLVAVAGSWTDSRSTVVPAASPAPAPIIQTVATDGTVSAPARQLPGFAPR